MKKRQMPLRDGYGDNDKRVLRAFVKSRCVCHCRKCDSAILYAFPLYFLSVVGAGSNRQPIGNSGLKILKKEWPA